MTTCSGHVLRLDLYLLKEGRTNFLLKHNGQSTSSIQVGDIYNLPKFPVVCCVVQTMQSYPTPDFVFELRHVVVSCCLIWIPIRKWCFIENVLCKIVNINHTFLSWFKQKNETPPMIPNTVSCVIFQDGSFSSIVGRSWTKDFTLLTKTMSTFP